MNLESATMLDLEQQAIRSIEWEASARQLFYDGRHERVACLLSTLVDRSIQIPIKIPARFLGEMTPCNPSVAIGHDKRVAIVRAVNYRQCPRKDEIKTVFVARKAYCWTDNLWIEFDASWTVRDVRLIVDPIGLRPGSCQGYEDCRLFASEKGWHASATIAERPQVIGPGAFTMLLREMALLDLSVDGEIEEVHAVRGPWSVYHQKNWKPLSDGGAPRWIYSTEPLLTLSADDARARPHIKWFPGGDWRGSSQALPVAGGWLWVDHRMIEKVEGLGNVYVHRFVFADKQLSRVLAVSRPFVFSGYGVEFCAGLALDGGRLVLSYSTRDANAQLAIVDLGPVLASLRAVA